MCNAVSRWLGECRSFNDSRYVASSLKFPSGQRRFLLKVAVVVVAVVVVVALAVVVVVVVVVK